MKILKYKKYPKEELIRKLRKVSLLHSSKTDNPIYLYKEASIEVSDMPVSLIMPSQLYQLEESLLRVNKIQKALTQKNIDLYNLDGFISYVTSESDTYYTLLPIIIEFQAEKNGLINPLIVDGIHRIIMAKNQKQEKIQVVKISNVNKDFPYPAFVNSNGWSDVKLMDKPPLPENKRNWRFPIEKAYSYYRDFNSAFENVGKPRTS